MTDIQANSIDPTRATSAIPADAYLSGQGTSLNRPPAITKYGAGGKFTSDGMALPYPGNTFLTHVDKSSDAFEALCEMQNQLRGLPMADAFVFLPQSSFHMTVFNGVSGDPLSQDGWPDGVVEGTALADISGLFETRTRDLAPIGKPIVMSACKLYGGFSLFLEPSGNSSSVALKSLRNSLEERTGLHRPGADHYVYHISLGYLLRWLAPDEIQSHLIDVASIESAFLPRLSTIELEPLELCEFKDMCHFESFVKSL